MTPTLNAQSIATTKILALGTLTGALTAEQQHNIMPQEVPGTVRLYLNGVEEAHSLLEALPPGREHLMKFELIPLGPLFPLELLLRD